MGGIIVLNSLTKLNKDFIQIKELIFLNCPIS